MQEKQRKAPAAAAGKENKENNLLHDPKKIQSRVLFTTAPVAQVGGCLGNCGGGAAARQRGQRVDAGRELVSRKMMSLTNSRSLRK